MVTIAATLVGVGAAAATSAALARFKSKEIQQSVHQMQKWVSHFGSGEDSPYKYIPVEDNLTTEGVTEAYERVKATLKNNKKELAILEKNNSELISSIPAAHWRKNCGKVRQVATNNVNEHWIDADRAI